MPSARVARPALSVTSLQEGLGLPPTTTATLRSGEENSSAKIFIADTPVGLGENFDFYPAKTLGQRVRRARPSVHAARFANFSEPPLCPFDHRDSRRV